MQSVMDQITDTEIFPYLHIYNKV